MSPEFDMDVIVLDDSDEVADAVIPRWEALGVTVFHTANPDDLLDPFNPDTKPAKWPRAPHARRLAGIVLDLDLGEPLYALGGMTGAANVARARHTIPALMAVPVVLRTQLLSKERDLAAVFAAELLGQPLSWWDRNRSRDDRRLLEYLSRLSENPTATTSDLDVRLIEPVMVRNIKDDGNAQRTVSLAETLLRSNRWKLWARVDRYGQDALAHGHLDADQENTWEDMQRVPTALNHLLDIRQPLSSLKEIIDVEVTDAAVLERRAAVGRFRHDRRGDAAAMIGTYRDVLVNRVTARLFAESTVTKFEVDVF